MTEPAGALARSSDKAPTAYRTISEVANELGLPQHVLRFWETRFGQIRPLKRGGGRRYYRPDDIALLKGIQHLLYNEGYTIRGVQKLLKAQGVRAVQEFGGGRALPEVYDEPEADDLIEETLPPTADVTPFPLREEPILEEERAGEMEDLAVEAAELPLFNAPAHNLTASYDNIAPRLRALRDEVQACRDLLKSATQ